MYPNRASNIDRCRMGGRRLPGSPLSSTTTNHRHNFVIELLRLQNEGGQNRGELVTTLIGNFQCRPPDGFYVYETGVVAGNLFYHQWSNALDTIVYLWEVLFDGGGLSFMPRLVVNANSNSQELNCRLIVLFKERILGFMKGVQNKFSKELIGEFKSAMECILDYLDRKPVVDHSDVKVLTLEGAFDWNKIYWMINRERRRLDAGLPIYADRTSILWQIHCEQVIVLTGESDSGKSTQMVQFLADSGVAGDKSIVCIQPHKLVATSLANRVKEESHGCCSVICSSTYSSFNQSDSKVIYMTDHCLLEHYMNDKNLSWASCIILDEAHVRSLTTNLLLAIMKDILLYRRSELRFIMMSATADAQQQLSKYFFGCASHQVVATTFLKSMPCHHEPNENLGIVVLRILALGFHRIDKFDFIDASCNAAIKTAIKNLIQLGAIALENGAHKLTKDGWMLVKLGIEPKLGISHMDRRELQLKVLTGFGRTLLKRFCWSLKHLVSHIRDAVNDDRIHLEVPVDHNTVNVYAPSEHMRHVSEIVSSALEREGKWIQNECLVKCLFPGSSHDVALLGSGAEIKHLELEKRCLTVDIFVHGGPCGGVDETELLSFLEKRISVNICAVHKLIEKWVRVTFLTPEAAEKATKLTTLDFKGCKLKIAPSRSIYGGHLSFPAVKAKVLWPLRRTQGVAYVKCNPDDVTRMVKDFSNMLIGGNFIYCRRSLCSRNSVILSGLDVDLFEDELFEVLKGATNREILNLSLPRAAVVENPSLMVALEEALLKEVSSFMPAGKERARVRILPCEPMDYFMKAEIGFDASLHLEAAKALEQINGKSLPGCHAWQKIKCQQHFTSIVSCPTSAYIVIKDQLHFLLKTLELQKGVEFIIDENENGTYRVKISANATKIVAESRRSLELLMNGNIIHEEVVRNTTSTHSQRLSCSICLCDIEDGYRLEKCNHEFCRSCLVEQCESAIKNPENRFPIRCAHEGCGALILVVDLKSLLSIDKLDELFRASLGSFVASSHGKYRFCPSTDCTAVYQVDGRGRRFACEACSGETCTQCHLKYHPLLSCDMYKELRRDPDLSLKTWIQGREEKVKQCPVCMSTIEKIDGCNKIECRCGNYICWLCQEHFLRSTDCYAHLLSLH